MICIVIPAYNEEKKIVGVIKDVKDHLKDKDYQILIIDDASHDKTSELIREQNIEPLVHKENKGYGGSLITGFSKALELDADIIVTFDGDGQHKAMDIKNIIAPIERGLADVVIGTRNVLQNKEIPTYRKAGISVITGLTRLLLGLKITDAQSGFRAYNRRALKALSLKDEGMGFSIEILFDVAEKKLKFKEVPITCLYQECPHSENPVKHGIILLNAIFSGFLRRKL